MSRPDRRGWVRTDKRATIIEARGRYKQPRGVAPQVDLARAESMCFGKSGFYSEVDANRKAARIVADGGPPMRAYSCPMCGLWHLTRNGARQIREVR